MPEQLWPLILVGLLASLVVSSIPWLVTLDPNRPEGMLVQVLQTLEEAHDLDAHIVLTGPEGPAVTFQLRWLRGEDGGALKITFLAPKELRGEMFTLRSGLLAHWRPDPQGDEGVIVRLTLPQQDAPEEPESPFAWVNFDPRELITGIRLGTVRVTAQRERLGEGWEQLLEKVHEYSLPITLTSHGDPFGAGLLFAPLSSPHPIIELTLPTFGTPRPGLPTLRGPIRLEVRGRFSSAPAFQKAVLWLDEGEQVPHRLMLYLGGKDGDLVLSMSLLSLKTDVGLTLREVLALPPAKKTIWE